ncbi:protein STRICTOSIDINE SYNTHASE-LIKE 4-like [Lotus japonicus]|uniref:protein STRICTOSIDINE SYNTHASE-LIKE 4-like n=1 Tax=Lotus japonicus TaxID=34305 RepID=UPI002585EB63|nr:protein STRICTOSIDINE SYNTHASE-LIKE 4-like [Lotus japonicus]
MVAVTAVLYRLDPFDPVHFPADELSRKTATVPARNSRMMEGSELVARGEVTGPEDLAYDKKRRVIYTGCGDGWIKRVTVNESVDDSVVENWVNTGGRPLGLALERNGELIVADADLWTHQTRCRKYYIQGPKKGTIGEFCPDIPGMPDNIHYVGQGQYFIGLATVTYSLTSLFNF